MKLIVDTEAGTLERDGQRLDLFSVESFELLSHEWLKLAWNHRYQYTFSWLGRPIFQLPEDIMRIQEVVYRLKPDVIIECGIAFGGSLVLYAGLCRIIGKGRVIGVEKRIREVNREALETHELSDLITLIHGNSIEPEIIARVKGLVQSGERVMVILDSSHTKKHVLAELEAYSHLVSLGSYIVVTDGFMKEVTDVPSGKEYWLENNPIEAVREFLEARDDFALEPPKWTYNDTELRRPISFLQEAWLKKKVTS